jgi:hypothetical protein
MGRGGGNRGTRKIRVVGLTLLSSEPKVKQNPHFETKKERLPPEVFNKVYPVEKIITYGNGVIVVKRKCLLQQNPLRSGRKERPIMRFTAKSMARLIATVNATDVKFRTLTTLTYPALYPKDGRIVKEDANRILNYWRENEWQYLWFLEFQVRGAPHLHILSDVDAITPIMRIELTERWCTGIAKSDWIREAAAGEAMKHQLCETKLLLAAVRKSFWFTLNVDTWQILRSQDGAARYATKYAAKEYQKIVPEEYQNVGRFWGCSKDVVLKDGVEMQVTEDELREYLKSTEHTTSDWDVLPKYLFNVKNT